MNDPPQLIRPETRALDALIRETIARVEASPDGVSADTMIFLGNRHQSFPTAVIRDPVLEPVDKLVWMVVMLAVHDTGGNTAFPGYKAIARLANIASRSTVARAIAILRATRWLTLCGRLRMPSGRYRGNLYALHDEPLPLADAIHLDRDYMDFLSQAIRHGHARVRAVAQGVLDSIDEDIQGGMEPGVAEHPIERRVRSMMGSRGGEPRRFFAFTPKVIRRLRADLESGQRRPQDHDQNSNSGCSSSNNKKTTTADVVPKFVGPEAGGNALVYPRRLSDNQREIANRYLRTLPRALQQPVLDELEGRFQAERKGMKPVYDEIRFLARLCELARSGDFQPNLGIKVREAREARSLAGQRAATPVGGKQPQESDPERERRIAEGRRQMAAMRKALGMPNRHNKLSNNGAP